MVNCEEIRKGTGISREDFEEGLWELEEHGILIIKPLRDHLFAVYFNPAWLEEVGLA